MNRFCLAVLSLGLLLTMGHPAAGQADYETPPIFDAGDLLPKELLKGPHHEIEPQVVNDGYMNYFTIRSDFGTFGASSQEMVATRVREVHALAELKKLSGTDVFVDALGRTAEKTVKSVGRAVTDPVGTVKGVGQGVGRMFKRMSLTAKKVTDSAREAAAGEQEAGGEEEAAAKGEEVAKNLIGYNRAKRGMAKEMGIDPYSDNEVLQAELERLAKAAFAGGLAFDVLAPSVPLQGEIVMVSDMVWTRSPADLEVMNREKLVGLGISKETVDTFYRNEHFTPSTQTALVALVEKLEGVKNLGAIPRLASRLKSSDEVRFFIHTAAILTRYHEEDPLQRIAGRHVLPWGVRADGKTVLPAAIDHMVWTKRTSEAFAAAEKARAEEESLGAMELRVSGTLSPRTRREVESLGWRVEEKALRAN